METTKFIFKAIALLIFLYVSTFKKEDEATETVKKYLDYIYMKTALLIFIICY